jgi:hypothetical protein
MANSNLVLSIIAVDKASKTLGGIGSSLGKMSINTAALGATLVAFGATSIKAFSDSEQAQVKLNDAFEKFPNLADTNVGALNALNAELQKKTRFDDEAYAAAQATLAQYGLTGQQLKDLTPLVADFAAKTGKTLPDASAAIGKALMGQGRALKSVGINFKDAGSTGANFTQIMSGLRTQVGGFAEKEGQTAAGKADILKNQFGELQEKVGALLVPALTSLVGVLTPIIEGFNSLPGPVQTFTFALVAAGAAAVLFGPKILGAVRAFAAFRTALLLTTRMMGTFNVSMLTAGRTIVATQAKMLALRAATGLAAVGLIILIGAVSSSIGKTKELNDTASALRDTLSKKFDPTSFADLKQNVADSRDRLKELNDAASAENISSLSGAWTNFTNVLAVGYTKILTGRNALMDLDQSISDSANALFALNQPVVDIASKYGVAESAVSELAVSVYDSNKSYLENKTALDAAVVAQFKATSSAGSLSAAQEVIADTASTVADKVKAYREQLDALGGGFVDSQAANDNLTTSIQKAQAEIKKNGGSLKGNSVAALANRAALRDVAGAADDASAAVFKQTINQDKANAALVRGRENVIKMATKLGMSKTAANNYADSLGLIPKKVTTKIVAKTEISKADKALLADLAKLGIKGEAAGKVLNLTAFAQLGGVNGMAAGGPVSANTPYIVGERRPELFVPSTSGRIVPRVPNVGTMAAGGSTIIVNTGQSVSSKDDIAREIRKIMREGAQRGAVPAAWNVA